MCHSRITCHGGRVDPCSTTTTAEGDAYSDEHMRNQHVKYEWQLRYGLHNIGWSDNCLKSSNCNLHDCQISPPQLRMASSLGKHKNIHLSKLHRVPLQKLFKGSKFTLDILHRPSNLLVLTRSKIAELLNIIAIITEDLNQGWREH